MAKALPDKEWFVARMRALRLTQANAASQIGMHQGSLGRALTGARDVTAAEVVRMAEVLQTTYGEVIRRLGHAPQAALEPAGRVLPDGRVSTVVDTRSLTVGPLGEYPADAAILIVEAAEGPLASWDGAALVYVPSRARTAGPDAVGRLCVIEDAGSPLPVVGELRPATGSRGNIIRVFGTGEELVARRVIRASPVLGIHLRA